jgi:hypothetical protein
MLEKFQKETSIDLSKAQSIAGAATGSTDYALIPLYVEPSIVEATRRLTPLVELVPRVTNYGRTAEFNRLIARGVVGFQVEDAPLSETNDTYERKQFPMKFAYQVGRVTGPFLAASKQYLSQQYVDALNMEIRNKTITMRYTEEDALLNGNSSSRSAYGYTTVAGNEYLGIRNTAGLQTANQSGANITLSNLRAAIKSARTANDSATLGQGSPDLMVTDFTTFDNLKGLMMDFQRFIDTNKLSEFGITSFGFDGLSVIPSKFMPTAGGSREIEILDTSTWQMRVLQDITYEELAKTNDSYKFMLKLYECPICTVPEFNCKVYGIA